MAPSPYSSYRREKIMSGRCCELGSGLTENQIARLRELFLQQGIQLNAEQWVARIKAPGTKENCPYRFTLGEETDYCASECHLQAVVAKNAEARNR